VLIEGAHASPLRASHCWAGLARSIFAIMTTDPSLQRPGNFGLLPRRLQLYGADIAKDYFCVYTAARLYVEHPRRAREISRAKARRRRHAAVSGANGRC
jgi:hypothetical protein